MPNYKYRCFNEWCDHVEIIELPISSDPKYNFPCPKCPCDMRRVIIGPQAVTGLKEFAGDWFKKTYGRDIGEPYEDTRQRKEDENRMKKKIKELNNG